VCSSPTPELELTDASDQIAIKEEGRKNQVTEDLTNGVWPWPLILKDQQKKGGEP
jgi:hypothetical protein